MTLVTKSKYVEKKSKFEAELYFVKTEDEMKNSILDFTKQHKKANHICYAVKIDDLEQFKNDGEVGHPGNKLLNLLKTKNLNNNLLIVARYFGGIKLGPAGVGKAFLEAGKNCVEKL